MKRKLYMLVILLLGSYIVIQQLDQNKEKVTSNRYSDKTDQHPAIAKGTKQVNQWNTTNSVSIANAAHSGSETEKKDDVRAITVPAEQIYYGDLLLVNEQYPVREEAISSDIVRFSDHKSWTAGYSLKNTEIEASKRLVDVFEQMIGAARNDKVNHFVVNSGFRSLEEQEQLYQELAPGVALPAGYSEHNLGLALDIGSTQMKMEHAPEGQWLADHSWEYGFILRYPEEKTDITGTMYEPWHYRYVGLPHSALMKEMDFVLEEYLDYLKQEKRITVPIGDETYEVYYYPVDEDITIDLPTTREYQISGDNVEGIIVTVFPNS